MQELYSHFLKYPIAVTDTRAILPDSIFFALKGPNFNANEFAEKALESGSKFAVIDEAKYKKDDRFILVEDVLTTLQKLANHHRKQFSIPVLALTGTNGKTTTKELIHAVLSQKFNVLSTKGNLNNHIGVPLTLLNLKKEHDFAVIEMGANKRGDIKELCDIADPDYGMITNIGKAHLEGFGDIESVLQTKTEIYQHIRNKKGKIFINTDNLLLKEKGNDLSHESYGFNSGNLRGRNIQVNPFLSLEIISFNRENVENSEEKIQIQTHLVGTYNAENILAACCIGNFFGVENQKIKSGLENYIPSNNRSQIIQKENCTILMDAYNANPSSMKAAIENFAAIHHPDKYFVLGDMFELGESSELEHQQVIELADEKNLKGIFVGKAFFSLKNEKNKFLTTTEEAKTLIQLELKKGRLYLIKGSRGMKLETLLEVI
jgi:UDP-N-acetylmuramoyl-tripeptide--D-alanyl-D-alanine ligase